MDRPPPKDLSSWSIPKKASQPPPSQEQQQQQQQQQEPRLTMNMAIPKKKPSVNTGNPPPSLLSDMTIPRRTSTGSHHSSGSSHHRSPLDAPIPRRNTHNTNDRDYHPHDRDRDYHPPHHQQHQHHPHHHHPKPKPRPRPSYEEPSYEFDEQHRKSKPASSTHISIPRKKYVSTNYPPAQSSTEYPPPIPSEERPVRSGGMQTISEYPFTIRIPLKGVPMDLGGVPRHRASSRTPKRRRPTYKELADTDSDDFFTDSDTEGSKPKKKKNKLKNKLLPADAVPETAAATTAVPGAVENNTVVLSATATLGLNNISVDSPPPGTLNTLWYSRECFSHVFVLEKVLAWKTRVVTQMEWVPESLPETGAPTPLPAVDLTEAHKFSNLALSNPLVWMDPKSRMEVSRLVPDQCPIVMAMACQAQPQDAEGPKFRIKPLVDTNTEEVYLVKWRGRSHVHASWERPSDLIKYDQSNNTARHKIRRFVQSQEVAFGIKWKQVLEEERKTAGAIHAHGQEATAADAEAVEEEYFPPAAAEVDRILACDESEMNLALFAKQRALNIKLEEEEVQQKELGTTRKWNSPEGLQDLLKGIPWDPEDNVRYVVKWKGLPFAEITWEYWRDIKWDAVDDAEDFWWRQKPPTQEVISQNHKPHPHVRDFRKIQESPVYGRSERKRPVFGQEAPQDDNDEDSPTSFKLRSYQLEGVNWLLFNWFNKRSCILADEMGLGKTIQSLCFLTSLQTLPTTGVRGPFLIVAPLSLIGQWQSEARTWAPDLNVVLYHGSADARDFLVKQDFFYTDQFVPKPQAIKLKKQHVTKFHILITTYEVVLKDVNIMSKIRWRALIVDEAHRLKNSKSRLFEDLLTVPRDYCVLLTGTPLANATEELWALLHFANKAAFGDKEDFLEKFGNMTDAKQVNDLHTLLKPYLLRRVKEDVEKSLPPKVETILEVSLTPIQKKYYKAIYERNTAFLYKGAKPSNAPSLMNVMMELRKCCNHPYLVRGAEERILSDAANQIRGTKDSEGKDVVLDYTKLFGEQLIKSSGKMVLISKLLPKLFSNGHKVLIFSQMVRVLDLLEELVRLMKYKYERLDGSTSSSSRVAAVDRFIRKSCQRFVMLLSTRAGGLGLNLTAADIVIIFDSDWNPQNDLQAMARAHRIGQTRAVRVYRLLTAKTYEMHMFHSASMKLGLERAVLSQQRDQGEEGEDGKSKTKSNKEAQAKEIDSLLKKGAYDVFRDDDDDEAKKFMETDIDQLLERNASTVTYDAKSSSLESNGLGSFSKASFVADTGDGEKDVDLDDPDFWAKAVGLDAPVETPEEIAQMLDDGVKRSRKQVQVYDPYAEFAEIEQRKQDKIDKKNREEKEEKERLRQEKKKKKRDEKERKQRERDELRESLFGKKTVAKKIVDDDEEESPPKKQHKEPKPKKAKKQVSDKRRRQRRERRERNENPEMEKIKQAWDSQHRNRALAAFLRFGFARFCKVRNESNLTSVPIHDFEHFFRSYFYQLSLQVVVTFLQKLRDENKVFTDENIKDFLRECLGPVSSKELDWLCDCFSNGMKYYLDVESHRRPLRLPLVLAEPDFVSELRRGPALRSLRRMFILCRVQRIVEDRLDEILTELGYEQLGKRGCPTSNIASMDADLKARLVSTEELSLAIGSHFEKVDHRAPVAWWDRSCDIALLIGTFIHGLGNYDAMLNDDALPFAFKIRAFAGSKDACVAAHQRFNIATTAARKVFDDALEAYMEKDRQKTLVKVAEAHKASADIESNAKALREGGAAADAVLSNMPEEVPNVEIDEDDSDYVTLPRLKSVVCSSLRNSGSALTSDMDVDMPAIVSNDAGNDEESTSKRKSSSQHLLSMPDARILDYRLHLLFSEIERNAYPAETSDIDVCNKYVPSSIWPKSDTVSTNCQVLSRALSLISDANIEAWGGYSNEYMGIGVNGTQCGLGTGDNKSNSNNPAIRSLDDGTDYSIGAASPDLAQVANGVSSHRYNRAIGVPMNLTRYALSALVHASESNVDQALAIEQACSNVNSEETTPGLIDVKKEETEASPLDKSETPKPEAINSEEAEKKPRMPEIFEVNAALRASICTVVLNYGFPFKTEDELKVSMPIWNNIREQCGQVNDAPPDCLFTAERFMSLIKEIAGDMDIPDFRMIKEYVEISLLPHCLRLCVVGNGPNITNNSRWSYGNYVTANGTSLYQEHTENLQTPIPDPCLPLVEHSLRALALANAILRRVRLMRTLFDIATGKLPSNQLDDALRSSSMRKSMGGLPVWWCPWIHDAALLVHASTRGLFSIMKDRNSEDSTPLAFSREIILQHMYSTFVAVDNALPSSVVDNSPPEDSQTWIEQHAHDFPTLNVLERRLAFLCAKATEHLDGEERFENLPMFDHGGWPRN